MSDAIQQPAATETPVTTTPDKPTEVQAQTPPADKSPSPKENPQAAAAFARAVKREKDAARVRQQLEAEKSQIAQMRKEIEAERQRLQGYKQDPLAALRESGLNLDPQTQALVGTLIQNQGNTPESQIAALNQRIEALARGLAERDRQAEESKKAAEEAGRQQSEKGYRGELVAFAKANGETYEWAAQFDEKGEIAFEVAKKLYQQSVDDGEARMPDTKTVMDKVEAYFEEQFGRVAQNKKFAAKFGPNFAPKTPEPPKTLTNAMGQTTATVNGVSAKTEAERIARALAALEAAERRTA